MNNKRNYFKKVLIKEINAVNSFVNNISMEEIEKVIELLENNKGSVVVTGLGKSGIIGLKLAATFSSLGTRAIFVHAAEAMHGDLGSLHESDTVLALSHSGETDEVLRFVAFAKSNSNKVISITNNKNSTLAKKSNACICYDLEEEACHLNLAPTSSTTIQLMAGDAIAVTLAYYKKYKQKDFSRVHPSGSLGKRLLLKISEVMRKNSAKLSPESNLLEAVIEMTSKQTGIAMVLDKKSDLVGVLTDGDLRRALLHKSKEIELITVESICSKKPHKIKIDSVLDEALYIMQNKSITGLIVVDLNNRPIGVITIQDIERAIAQ